MTAAPPDRPARRGANASRGVLARLAAPRPPRSRLRRRLGAGVRMIFALALVGGIYAGFAPSAIAQDTSGLSQAADRGKAIFDQSCASCHGNLGQGVPDKGPSLIGVGSAAVEFQVSTGRMPMARQEAQAERKKPMFTAVDNNLYVRPAATVAKSLVTWSPAAGDSNQYEFKTVAELQAQLPPFEAHSQALDLEPGHVLRSPDLKNYALIRTVPVKAAPPAEIITLLGWPKQEAYAPGAYQK